MLKIAYLLMTTALVRAFNNNGGTWKKDADGHLVIGADGNPVLVDASGAEKTIEPGHISRLNGESRGFRERAERAEGSLKAFEGLDPAKAREALDTVGKLDLKKLVDAGEIDKVKEQISAGFTQQIQERDAKLKDAQGTIDNMRMSNAFRSSKFVSEQIAVPINMFEATFRPFFETKDGAFIAKDRNGNPIYSTNDPGRFADFDEAIQRLVETDPHKDMIIKAKGHGGTGSDPKGNVIGRKVTRADFEAADPGTQAKYGEAMAKGELTIVDPN